MTQLIELINVKEILSGVYNWYYPEEIDVILGSAGDRVCTIKLRPSNFIASDYIKWSAENMEPRFTVNLNQKDFIQNNDFLYTLKYEENYLKNGNLTTGSNKLVLDLKTIDFLWNNLIDNISSEIYTDKNNLLFETSKNYGKYLENNSLVNYVDLNKSGIYNVNKKNLIFIRLMYILLGLDEGQTYKDIKTFEDMQFFIRMEQERLTTFMQQLLENQTEAYGVFNVLDIGNLNGTEMDYKLINNYLVKQHNCLIRDDQIMRLKTAITYLTLLEISLDSSKLNYTEDYLFLFTKHKYEENLLN